MIYKSMFLSPIGVINHIITSDTELTPVQTAAISATLTSSYVSEPYQSERLGTPGNVVGKFMYNGTYLPYTRILTKYGFNSRFTFEELVAIQDAAKTDTAVAVLQTKFTIADEIDLDDPATVYGLSVLVAKGLLTEARAAEIMQ